jgi:predicted Zn-dependent peptidase
MRKCTLILILLLVSASLWAALQEVEKNVSAFTLSNGLKVIVYENHMSPVFSAVTYANVGSVDEVAGITGLAHIFEHMAFKGTSTVGTKDYEKEKAAIEKEEAAFMALKAEKARGLLADPARIKQYEEAMKAAQDEAKQYVVSNEFSQVVEREGAEGLNASTAFDQTQYYYSFPSNKLELWAYMESERFLDPVLREFHTEKNVIAEERRMGVESQPVGRMIEEFLGLAYKAHPYGVDVVGHMSDILNMSRDQAMKFFRDHYTTENMVLSLAGDVYPDQAKVLLEKYFGRLPRKPAPAPITTVEPPQLGERSEVIKDPSQPILIMGFHKASFNDPDNPVFTAITDVMGTGRTSRLYKRLVRDEKLALDAGAFSGGLGGEKYPGMFLFYAVPMQGKTNADCKKAILEEIEKMKAQPVTTEELARVKTRAKGDFIRGLQSDQGMAAQLAYFEEIAGSWKALFTQLDKIDKVTPDDIQRVAQKTFTESNRTVVALEHEEGGAK